MCFGRPYVAAGLAVALIIFGIGIIFMIPGLSLALAKAWSMKLDEDSSSWDYWIQSRKPIVSQKFFFNITNPYEVLTGAKPIVQQLGPYTYIAVLSRVNVSFGGKDRVSFNNKYSVEFLRSESIGAESDEVTIVNPELLVALSQSNEIPEQLVAGIQQIYSRDPFGGLFVTQSVYDILAGKIGPLFRALNISQGVAFMTPKNETIYPRTTTYTGKHDIDEIMNIVRYNNHEDLPYWHRKECSSLKNVRGDYSFGPPIDDDDINSIHMFMFGCRKVKWNVVDDDYNIEAYDWEFNTKKFSPDERLFDNMYVNVENDCYESKLNAPEGYHKSRMIQNTSTPDGRMIGMPSGVFDLTPVASSILISNPHFEAADPYFQNSMIGLRSDPKYHKSVWFIEPKLGVTINCSQKFQMNLPLNPSIKGKQFHFSNAPAIVYPVVWQSHESGIPRSGAKKLYLVIETSWVIGFSIGPLFSIFGAILLFLAVRLIQSDSSNMRPPAYQSDGPGSTGRGERMGMTYQKASQPEDRDWVATSTF